MNNLIKINLLPYREEMNKRKQQQFKTLMYGNEAVPGSTYLTSLDAVTADSYRLSGRTSSDNRVAAMMRAMPNTGIFKQPELLSIKKNNSHQEFTLQATLQPIVKAAESKENPASGNAQEAN